jgi:hypothetical protein
MPDYPTTGNRTSVLDLTKKIKDLEEIADEQTTNYFHLQNDNRDLTQTIEQLKLALGDLKLPLRQLW